MQILQKVVADFGDGGRGGGAFETVSSRRRGWGCGRFICVSVSAPIHLIYKRFGEEWRKGPGGTHKTAQKNFCKKSKFSIDRKRVIWYPIRARKGGLCPKACKTAMKREIASKGGNFRGACPASALLSARNRAAEIFSRNVAKKAYIA